ncbi:MAG: hypothetical protein RL213_703 [Bacteroidota bacterium]|jgi:hypothetical protein
MFKPGDKVRFLNEAIEGHVSRVLSGDRLEIIDSFGFLHQAARADVVPVEFVPEMDHISMQTPTGTDSLEEPAGQFPSSSSKTIATRLIQYFEPDETVYGVLELKDPSSPLISDVEIWLVNTTEMHLSILASREKGEYRSHPVTGQMNPRSEMLIGLFTQDQLYRMDGMEFQFILYSNREYRPRQPLVKHMELRPADLLEAASNRFGTLFDQTLKVPLLVLREEVADINRLIRRFTVDEEELRSSRAVRKDKKRGGFTILSREKVVDLHIEELLKDHSGLSPGQIIAYQLSVFEKEMDQALLDHLNRITFIHGVGSGVLRSAIREALKKFDNISYCEAPAEKFGGGATQIDFK